MSQIGSIGAAGGYQLQKSVSAEIQANAEANEQAAGKTKEQSIEAAGFEKKVSEKNVYSVYGETNASVKVSADGDIMEISQKGMEKAQSMQNGSEAIQNQPSEEETVQSTSTDAMKAAVAQMTDEEDETESATDLSQYSEYELKQKLSEGSITSAQYAAEMKRRQEVGSSDQMEPETEQKYDADIPKQAEPITSNRAESIEESGENI